MTEEFKSLPTDQFALEKEQILSQFILHHEVADHEVIELAERLDRALETAERYHRGQKRKSGEPYIYHPIRTAMEVSRFGRIIDWASVEACLLHDTLEDTSYSYDEIRNEFPDAADLVEALTKIKDSRELTYHKLFSFVLQDIRVLLVKIADRLDNLQSLEVFSREKQVRIASESAQMYANICRRLCMLELAERLAEKIGQYLVPEELERFRREQAEAKDRLARSLAHLRSKLAEVFPGDLAARIEVRWNRFNPDLHPAMGPEKYFTVRIVTEGPEEAYRALGRVHTTFPAIPQALVDTISNPRTNGYRALDTSVSYRGRIINFYITYKAADRFNRLGLLSMDIDSPEFNLRYLDELRDFLQHDDGNLQDFLKFQVPDAIQVVSPNGDIYGLEEGTTALDFAFAIHDDVGLRATGARINDEQVELGTELTSGDRVTIETAEEPVVDDRYLRLAHSRKALAAMRRYIRKAKFERAATTGRQWLLEAAQSLGIPPDKAEERARELSEERARPVEKIYRDICLGNLEIEKVLKGVPVNKGISVASLLRRFAPGRNAPERKVRRYDFNDSHIGFCPDCAPASGDDIEGSPLEGRLIVHRRGCPRATAENKIPLMWERSGRADLRDPGAVEMELKVGHAPGAFYSVVGPFRALGLEIETINMPDEDNILRLRFTPGTARTMDRLIKQLRKLGQVKSIKVMRDVSSDYSAQSSAASTR